MSDYIYDLEIQKIESKSMIKYQEDMIESYKAIYCKCALGEHVESHRNIGVKLCPDG